MDCFMFPLVSVEFFSLIGTLQTSEKLECFIDYGMERGNELRYSNIAAGNINLKQNLIYIYI